MKGRHWFLLGLGGFLAVATAVVARQQAGLEVAARLRGHRERHGALEARKAELERAIHAGSSAAVLLQKLERVGLELPRDTAFTILTVDPPDGGGGR
jgi:hypothetical protein